MYQTPEEETSILYEPWLWVIGFILTLIFVPTLRPILIFIVGVGAFGLIPLVPFFIEELKKLNKRKQP